MAVYRSIEWAPQIRAPRAPFWRVRTKVERSKTKEKALETQRFQGFCAISGQNRFLFSAVSVTRPLQIRLSELSWKLLSQQRH